MLRGFLCAVVVVALVGVPALGAADAGDDVREAFNRKVREVNDYMAGHDVVNTPTEELKAVFAGFRKDFEDLAAKATGDEELVARCRLAVEAMGLYVECMDGPDEDADAIDLAVEAWAKWNQVRDAADVMPAAEREVKED